MLHHPWCAVFFFLKKVFGNSAALRRLRTKQHSLVSEDCHYADSYVDSLAYLVGSARARNEVQLKDMDAAMYALYEHLWPENGTIG